MTLPTIGLIDFKPKRRKASTGTAPPVLMMAGQKGKKTMYILRNIFGIISVFHNRDIALEAYEDECRFCEFAGLYDAYTGETIAESW